jgi:drug/metabolite transporter (DMT)-like permease
MRQSNAEARADAALLMAQLLLCSCLWASGFILMKHIGADIPPVALAALRGVLAAGLLAAWFLVRRQSIIPHGREWRDWIVLGALQGAIPNTLTAYALLQITAALAGMIQASTPLMVAVLAHFLFAEERLTARRATGVLVGFAGIAILIGPAAVVTSSGSASGTLAMVATAISYAVGNLYVRSIPAAQPMRLALGQQIFSGLPTFALALAVSSPAVFAAAPAHAGSLLALGFLATALPIILFMHILRTAGPTRGSMTGYLVPFWTLLLGMSFLGETVGMREMIGGLVVLAGVAIVSRTGRHRSHQA